MGGFQWISGMYFVLVLSQERVLQLRGAAELSPDPQHVAVSRQIHSGGKAVGLQKALGPDYLCHA